MEKEQKKVSMLEKFFEEIFFFLFCPIVSIYLFVVQLIASYFGDDNKD